MRGAALRVIIACKTGDSPAAENSRSESTLMRRSGAPLGVLSIVMNDLPPPAEPELKLIATKRAPKRVVPVAISETIRQTTHRVSPSRATGRSVERHDQRRQPKRGRHQDSAD